MDIDNTRISQGLNRFPETGKPSSTPENSSKDVAPKDLVDLGSKPQTPQNEKELTVLFYMHGQYKDLHRTTASTFFKIENSGSDENVNIVAQLGRAKQDEPDKEPQHIDGDWSGVRRYYVSKHDHSDTSMTIDQWKDVEKKLPNNPLAHYSLGDAYQENGEKEIARQEYGKAKELGMLKYMEDSKSPESKKIDEEIEAATKPYEDACNEKKVFGSKPVEVLSEDTKMGDPSTLKDFVTWGMKNYPAKHYVLVVTGHGGAWIGALEMSPSAMSNAIKDGVQQAAKDTSKDKKLDTFLFNSCYMGNMEAAYEMKGTADINLSSENYSRGNMLMDWTDHIDRIEKNIKEKGEFDPKAFAKDFVEYYRAEGKEIRENYPEFTRWKESYLTLTAIDTKNLDKLVAEWKNFVTSCMANNVPENILFKDFNASQGFNSSAFNPAQTIFAFYDMIKDIGDIMKHVKENPSIPEPVKAQAEKVEEAIKNSVLAEQHEGKDMDNATGLTVWAPTNAVDIAFMSKRYEEENVPQFAMASGYLPLLKDAMKGADKNALKEFMNDSQLIKNINQVLGDKTATLTDSEKKVLGDAKDILTKHSLELKEKLDLTIPKRTSMSAQAHEEEPDYELYGEIGRGLVDEHKEGLNDIE